MAAAIPTPPRVRLIAEGASARLFESRDVAGGPAALKLSRDESCDAALMAEANASVCFTHPALLPVLAQGWDEAGRVWLLLPLLSGRTLADWSPSPHEFLDELGPVADALDLLHHGGVGHADLKSENILLKERQTGPALLLADLGLLSNLGRPAAGGTPAYLSPSRLDDKPLAWKDDLHSFAVLVFERLAGRLPWRAQVGEALLRDIRAGHLVPLRAYAPDLPGELDGFFTATLRGERQDECVMGWLDILRGFFGWSGLPRSLYLRSEQEFGGDIATREALAAWLSANLYSATSDHVTAGHEELRSLEELARGDASRLRRVLKSLLREQWLRDYSGQAVFHEEPAIVSARLREWLSQEERPDAAALAGWQGLLAALPLPASQEELSATLGLPSKELESLLEDLLARGVLQRDDQGCFESVGIVNLDDLVGRSAALPVPLFEALWSRAVARPGARLQLLGLAKATGAGALLAQVSQAELLDVIERAPGEVCDELRTFLRRSPKDGATEGLLGLLDVVRLVRTDALGAAIERYWTFDAGLSPEADVALNRLLVYQLADSGRVHEAQEFLKRWRERHGASVEGTPLEIQIAAREINLLGTYGAQTEAAALARCYQERFEGREGAWVLHMALANLAENRGDREEALLHSEVALAKLEQEGQSRAMELDLLAYIAGTIVATSDRSRWHRLEGLLSRAESLAAKLEIQSITHRVNAAKALQLLHRGDLAEAKQRLRQLHHSAERSGELKRALFIDTGLFIAARESSDYQELLSGLPALTLLMDGQESVREILNFKKERALLCIAVGELRDANDIVELALAAATESSQVLYTGLFLGLRGRLRSLAGQAKEAARELQLAVESLTVAHALRHRNEYQLELIAADPKADPDGTLIAAVIDHEEAVGERRLLPRAWQLEARRLRRAGSIREAALALEEAFRVAGTLVSPEHRWPLHVEAAELALAAGDRQAARADLERAVAILHDLCLQFTDAPVRERFLARPDRRAVLARLRSLGAE